MRTRIFATVCCQLPLLYIKNSFARISPWWQPDQCVEQLRKLLILRYRKVAKRASKKTSAITTSKEERERKREGRETCNGASTRIFRVFFRSDFFSPLSSPLFLVTEWDERDERRHIYPG